jgi:hypothetical protein
MKQTGHSVNGKVVAMTAEMIAEMSRGARPGDKYRSITPEVPTARGVMAQSTAHVCGDPKRMRRNKIVA